MSNNMIVTGGELTNATILIKGDSETPMYFGTKFKNCIVNTKGDFVRIFENCDFDSKCKINAGD